MANWSADYDKRSYKDSKKRRRQAQIAEQTGIIKPIRRNNHRKFFIIIIVLAVVIAAVVGAVLWYNNQSQITPTTQSQQISETEELLTIVNLNYPLSDDYIPNLVDYENVQVNELILDDLKAMVEDAQTQGISLKLSSAYISYSEQDALYTAKYNELLSNSAYTQVRAEATAQRLVPKAGESEEQTGMIVGFDLSGSRTKAFVERKCIEYGFILRYPIDKEDITHRAYSEALYRYVGTQNATQMRSLDMCLEEYVDYISQKEIN